MKLKMILSAFVATMMFGATVSPVMAQGKKKGHYKNGKAYGQHPSQKRKDDKRYRDSDRWRRDSDARRREDEARRWREAEWQRSRTTNSRSDLDRLSDQRQKTKNEWRNIALLSGGVAALGLIQKDNRLVFAGAAGALYSLYRYEQDRKSQSQVDRLRASYFGREYFVRDGRRYDRRVVSRDGQKYYQFVRR